jgi:2'-5' RNA ligase
VSEDKKRRLFFAVNLSVAVTRKIADAQLRMRNATRALPVRVLWVPAANMHVTLKFLGWTRGEAIESVRDGVQTIVQGWKGFELVARGVGAFPREGDARVLWAGVEDPSGQLGKLAAAIEARMETLGFEKEARAYHPHVTLGRVKEGGKAGPELLAAARPVADFGSSLVREVVLYESKMKSGGSEYEPLARLPLDAPAWKAERQTREVETEPQEDPDSHGGQ